MGEITLGSIRNFVLHDPSPTAFSTLSLHDALPISCPIALEPLGGVRSSWPLTERVVTSDRKSTRLNSSHANISYAVFCLKKKLQVGAGAQAAPARRHRPQVGRAPIADAVARDRLAG